MSYASILVHVDLGRAAPERVRLAASLANRFGATLIGVAAHWPAVPEVGNGPHVDEIVAREEDRKVL